MLFACFLHIYVAASRQAVVPGVTPSAPLFSLSILFERLGFSNATAYRFFDRVLLTHALALSARQFVRKKIFRVIPVKTLIPVPATSKSFVRRCHKNPGYEHGMFIPARRNFWKFCTPVPQ